MRGRKEGRPALGSHKWDFSVPSSVFCSGCWDWMRGPGMREMNGNSIFKLDCKVMLSMI